MQITAPAPIIYLPENLWSFFVQPGRELLIRVLGVEGKTLNLELGGEKFQARIGGTLNPEDFRPGQLLRVRIARTGNPVVLQLIPEEAETPETTELKLLYLLIEKGVEEKKQSAFIKRDVEIIAEFIGNFLKGVERTKNKGNEKHHLKKILGERVKALEIYYDNEKIVFPFLFADSRSWGYLELGEPEKKGKKIKIFYLKLFLEYLGLIEGIFGYEGREVFVDLFFANKMAFETAKKELIELKKQLSFYRVFAKINLDVKEIEPGYLIKREG